MTDIWQASALALFPCIVAVGMVWTVYLSQTSSTQELPQ